MKKYIFITANIGGYDIPEPFPFMDKEIDYYYVTDNKELKIEGFEMVFWDKEKQKVENKVASRMVKASPFDYVKVDFSPDAIYIWADACFKQKESLMPLVKQLEQSENMILTMKHPQRDCLYQEGNVCAEWGIIDKELWEIQNEKYLTSKYPRNNGLAATGIMLRKISFKILQHGSYWRNEIISECHRDQLSFDYICWKQKMKYDTFDFSLKNKYFEQTQHLKDRKL